MVEEDDRYVLNSGDDNMMNNAVDRPISKDSIRPVSNMNGDHGATFVVNEVSCMKFKGRLIIKLI